MTSATNHTIVGFFSTRGAAEAAVNDLIREGFSREEISVLASQKGRAASPDTPNLGPIEATGSLEDTGEKAAIGGMAGFVLGIAALAIPGVGPILAAGPLAVGLAGAAAGAATGGLIGVLTDDGVPEEHAQRYSKLISAGRVMVSVHAPAGEVDHAADILDRNGAIDIDEPGEHVESAVPRERTIGTVTPEGVAAARIDTGSRARERQQRRTKAAIHPGITGGGPQP
jgi:hypothetical protein